MLIGIGMIGFILGVSLLISYGGSGLGMIYILAISLFPILLGTYSLLNIYNYRVTYDSQKIELTNTFTNTTTIYWKDVDSIKYLSGFVSSIKIKGKDSKSITVNEQLIGFGEFQAFLSSNFKDIFN